jgi:hypothetical protein
MGPVAPVVGRAHNVVVAKWQTQQAENLKAGSSSLPGDTNHKFNRGQPPYGEEVRDCK